MTVAVGVVLVFAGLWVGVFLTTRAGAFVTPDPPEAVVRWAYYPPGAVPGVIRCSNDIRWKDIP